MQTTTLDLVPLTSSLEAAAEAHRTVRRSLADAPEDTVLQATLLVDELVSSVLTKVGAPLSLIVETRPDVYLIEVVGSRAAEGALADGLGIGRAILDSWARDWGVVDHSDQTSIWFSLDLVPAA